MRDQVSGTTRVLVEVHTERDMSEYSELLSRKMPVAGATFYTSFILLTFDVFDCTLFIQYTRTCVLYPLYWYWYTQYIHTGVRCITDVRLHVTTCIDNILIHDSSILLQ